MKLSIESYKVSVSNVQSQTTYVKQALVGFHLKRWGVVKILCISNPN